MALALALTSVLAKLVIVLIRRRRLTKKPDPTKGTGSWPAVPPFFVR
jgi:hypothetical protein